MTTEAMDLRGPEGVIHDVNVGWVSLWRVTCPCSFREEHEGEHAELLARAAAVQHLADNGATYRAKEFALQWGVPLVLLERESVPFEEPPEASSTTAIGDRVKSTSKNARLAHIVASSTRDRSRSVVRMRCGTGFYADGVKHEPAAPLCSKCAATKKEPA